jgi:hypothetical protein
MEGIYLRIETKLDYKQFWDGDVRAQLADDE